MKPNKELKWGTSIPRVRLIAHAIGLGLLASLLGSFIFSCLVSLVLNMLLLVFSGLPDNLSLPSTLDSARLFFVVPFVFSFVFSSAPSVLGALYLAIMFSKPLLDSTINHQLGYQVGSISGVCTCIVALIFLGMWGNRSFFGLPLIFILIAVFVATFMGGFTEHKLRKWIQDQNKINATIP